MRSAIALFAALARVGSIHAQTPRPSVAPAVISSRHETDPADSLYRVAHDLLARGEYGRSAQLFKDIGDKYPKSRYVDELTYNEAFARYRIGTTKELETASRLLEPRAKNLIGASAMSNATNESRGAARARPGEAGVAGLYIQVNKVLAQRGNSDAANVIKVASERRPGTVCDADDADVGLDVMGAVSLMEPSQAMPLLKRVLNRTDPCNANLRKNAVFMLGRVGDADAAATIAAVAKSDPSPSVRAEAINWLPKLMGDAGVSTLEGVLRTEQDERIQRAVVRALASSDNQRARTAVRTLIDRRDAPLTQRVDAVSAIAGQRTSAEDGAYLRELYTRSDNEEMKQAIVGAIARTNGPGADEWMLNVAKNADESGSVRSTAIGYVVKSGKLADWIVLYDGAQSLSVRSRIISALENRKEPDAADKLVDIAKTSTVGSLRLQALNALIRRKDPRVTQLLDEIVNGRRP